MAGAAAVLTLAGLPAAASALNPPDVYVREGTGATVGPWQRLPAQLSSLGPYEIGIGVQPTSDTSNRQAIEVDLEATPGSVPSDWMIYTPYTPYCQLITDGYGPIFPTQDLLRYSGNGVYTVKVSVYSTSQYKSRSGNTCSGGPASTASFTVNAVGGIALAGNPVVPRTTLPLPRGSMLKLTPPDGATGDSWRCARDPALTPDGSVTGSPVTSYTSTMSVGAGISEQNAFTSPGRWACAAQWLGGDSFASFGTPWSRTQPFIVHGQYERDPRRTKFSRPAHGRVGLVVPAARVLAGQAAGGRLTLTLYHATCRGRRVALHRIARQSSVLDRASVAHFGLRVPSPAGFYLGRLAFGGNPVILASQDVDMDLLAAGRSFQHPTAFGFIDPRRWGPC